MQPHTKKQLVLNWYKLRLRIQKSKNKAMATILLCQVSEDVCKLLF